MKHRFRKYLGNRGSALFMVLSTMTALMVLVMAMYFSVVSSRAVQFKVFNQEQAYRTAVSISDTIIASISQTGGALTQNGTGGTTSLLATITNMEIGPDKAITTNANDFLAFDELNGTKFDDDQIGSYTVTITRFADETVGTGSDTAQVYDIAITTSVDGVYETAHSYITIVLSNEQSDPGRIKNIFTSTGYVPNDVYLDGGYYFNDVFYDNEYVMIGAQGSGTQKIYGDLTAAGTVLLKQCDNASKDKRLLPVTWAIGGDFIFDAQKTELQSKNGEWGRIIVGGDCRIESNAIAGAYFYVNGDLYLDGSNLADAIYYVNGNIYYNVDNIDNLKTKFYCNKSIYNKDGSVVSWSGTQKWDFAEGSAAPNTPHSAIMKELKALIGTQDYFNWKINDSNPGKNVNDPEGYDYIVELNKESAVYKPLIIGFNAGNKQCMLDKDGNILPEDTPLSAADQVVDGSQMTYVLEWQSKVCPNYFGKGEKLNYSAAVIKDLVKVQYGDNNSGGKECTLVIETGDDPDNQYFIKCLPNEDLVGADEKNDTFAFKTTTGDKVNVIVRGQGSVVIYTPEGVTFRDMKDGVTMHETWFGILGGNIVKHGSEYSYQSIGSVTSSANTKVANFVHKCQDGCTECDYDVDENVEKCPKDGCTGKLTEITCDAHNYTYTFCPVCEADDEPLYNLSAGKKEYYGLCDSRVDRAKVLSAANALSGDAKDCLFAGGSLTYPTTNIFLVSCDESANFMFSDDTLGISQNFFIGFIYAPYMTFKGISGSGGAGGFMKFSGGMIVSDYIIRQDMGYCSIYPEKLPTELMSANSAAQQLQGFDNKGWKIKLDSY